jgi:hypothetical protein
MLKLIDRISKYLQIEGSLLRFVLGTSALTIVLQFAYDIAKEGWDDWAWRAGALAGLLFVVLVIVLLFDEYIEGRQIQAIIVQAKNPPEKRRGLILLVSPTNTQLPMESIRFHDDRLAHCWLIHTSASSQVAAQVELEVQEKYGDRIHIHKNVNLMVDPNKSHATYTVVEDIFSNRLAEVGLLDSEVIADITGGQKPMSVGMALACSAVNRDMQYVITAYGPDGKIISANTDIELIRTHFFREIGDRKDKLDAA